MVTENDSLLIFLVLAPPNFEYMHISPNVSHNFWYQPSLFGFLHQSLYQLWRDHFETATLNVDLEIQHKNHWDREPPFSLSQPNLGFFFLIICNCYKLSIFANFNCHCAICKFCCAIDGLSVVEGLANCEDLTVWIVFCF